MRRLVRSKVWQNAVAGMGSTFPASADLGPRFGVGGAGTVSFTSSTRTEHPIAYHS